MKRVTCILTALLCAVALAACTSSPAPAEDPQDVPQASSDPRDQLRLIDESRALWLVTEGSDADAYQYAVTDLDENGRLEVIATMVEGSGRFSVTNFYEVSEDFSALQKLEYSTGDVHSEPDLGDAESFRCYKGDFGNFIVAMDEMRNGYAENYYYQDFLLLRNGAVDASAISYCMVLEEDSNGDGDPELHAYYYATGTEEEELSSADFARSADAFFGDDYEHFVLDLSWKQFDAAARTGEVDVPAALAESWNSFAFRKDDAAFEALFIAPSTYYVDLYENGEKADIVYGMESLADFWLLVEIGTELESRHASETGVDGHLIIGSDNLAAFRFNDPADARGPVEIEGMPVAMAEDGVGEPAEEGESGGADWRVEFAEDNGLNRFEAHVGPQDGRLYVTWYWWSEKDPGADPVITHMVFANGVV